MPPPSTAWSPSTAFSPGLTAQLQPLQSGLADFEASFSGDFERTGLYGAVVEQGHASYRFNKKTTVEQTGRPGDLSITPVQSKKLTAQQLWGHKGHPAAKIGHRADVSKQQ